MLARRWPPPSFPGSEDKDPDAFSLSPWRALSPSASLLRTSARTLARHVRRQASLLEATSSIPELAWIFPSPTSTSPAP
jgi:hypothetical protein